MTGDAPLPFNSACPRCGGDFRCGAKDASCACFSLKLGEALREQLKAQYGGSDCLCVACLGELQAQFNSPLPSEPDAGQTRGSSA